MEAIVARGAARPVPSVDDAREKLATLAAEIREVRPFVLASFNPEKCAAEVAPGLTASWHWGGPLQLGMVPVYQDERRRVREFQSLTFAVAVRVGHDGRIASELAPWVDVDTVDLEPSLALGANLAFLEPLHARLLDVFAWIDLAAIHDRVRRDAKGDAGTHPPSQEAVAASLEVPTTCPPVFVSLGRAVASRGWSCPGPRGSRPALARFRAPTEACSRRPHTLCREGWSPPWC